MYCPSPVCTTLSNFSLALSKEQKKFAPVADHDTATTAFGTPVTLEPLRNDVSYGTSVVAGTLDLGADQAGQQTSVTVAGKGVFELQAGAVRFSPEEGFAGKVSTTYTVQDPKGRLSNPAVITITVLPNATGALTLFSFEDGTEGWAPANWNPDAGTATQSSTFATEGGYGLELAATGGGWFGLDFPEALDLSGKTGVKYDLRSGGTTPLVALKVGPNYTWCQYSGGWVETGTTTTVDIAWDDFGCADFSPADVRGMYIYFNGGGTSQIDNVRAE